MKFILACLWMCILFGMPSIVLGWTLIGTGPDRMKQYFQYVDFENLHREKDVVHFFQLRKYFKKTYDNEKSEKNLFRVNCTTFKTSLVLTYYFSSEDAEGKPTRIRQPFRSPLSTDTNEKFSNGRLVCSFLNSEIGNLRDSVENINST